MTTPTTLDERAAVAIVLTLDPATPDFQEAVEIAFARRGSRDAVIVNLARHGDWDRVLNVFHEIRSTNPNNNEHIDVVYAIAQTVAETGSPAIAAAICRLHPEHRMLELLGKILNRPNLDAHEWLNKLAAIDLEVCYGFGE